MTGLIEDEEGPLTITLTPLPTWANFDPLQLYLSGTPLSPDRKSTNLTFTGQNQLGDSVSTTFTLTVLNNKPTVNGTFPSYQIFVGQLLNVTIPNIFDDRDGDLITVSLVPPYPAGINYSNATRNLWWTPRSGAQGANNLTFVGSDGQEEASAPLTINVPNRPPVFNEALPSFHIPVGKLFTYQVIPNATDPDEDPLVYDINSTKFNQVFTLSINPPVSYCPNGVVNYLVKVLDPFGGVGTTNFNITFFSEPPAITTPIPPLGAIVNTFLYYPIPANTFTTVPGMALTYQTEIGENSTWLSLSNGILSGTPNEPGLTLLNVTAIDGCGTRSSPTQLRITVSANGAGGNPPQVNAPILSFSKLSGEVFTFQIPTKAFVDPNGGNLTYLATQIDESPLYPWLFFNSATGAFIGDPAVTDVGNFGVLVRALNSQGVVSQPQWFTIILLDSNLPPIISKAPLPPAAYAEAFYSFYFGDVFTNPNGGSVETTAQFVAEWIQVNNETLFGTPWHQDVGSVTVTLTGVNARGLKAVTSFVLPVQGDNMYIYLTKIIGSVFTVISGLALAYKAYRSRVMLKQKGLQCITTLRGFRFLASRSAATTTLLF